jgi:hypothetical protein
MSQFNMITARIDGIHPVLIFHKSTDGWYINEKHCVAIDPKKAICITHPWFSDHICEAPQHNFRIVISDD